MIWPFWRFATFVVCIELLALAASVWVLWMKWNAVWWIFALQAFNVAAICGAFALAVVGLIRAYKSDKEFQEWYVSTMRKPDDRGA